MPVSHSLSSAHLSEDPLREVSSSTAVLIALTAMFLPVLLVSIVHGEVGVLIGRRKQYAPNMMTFALSPFRWSHLQNFYYLYFPLTWGTG